MPKKIIKYLENDLKDSIINDVRDVAHYQAHPRRKKKAGFFSIPRDVFCYVDYLGKISFGKGNTESAENYIKEYFPSKYYDYAELIYSMWRHGTVHEYKPKTYYADYQNHTPKRIRVAWLSNNDNKKETRKKHLKFFPMEGKRDTICLWINTCQLVDDLLGSLSNFIKKLRTDKELEKECQQRFDEASKEKELTDFLMGKSTGT